MPELTEIEKPTVSATEPEKKNDAAESDSDSDDTIPELEDAGLFFTNSDYLSSFTCILTV